MAAPRADKSTMVLEQREQHCFVQSWTLIEGRDQLCIDGVSGGGCAGCLLEQTASTATFIGRSDGKEKVRALAQPVNQGLGQLFIEATLLEQRK